jgi:hypothetical protein
LRQPSFFDRIYTKPLLAWRAIFRPLLFTLVVSVVFIVEYAWSYEIPLTGVIDGPDVLLGYFISYLVNAITDYISLFFIRRRLSRATEPASALIAGALMAALIVGVGAALRAWILFLSVLAYSGFAIHDSIWSALLRHLDLIAENFWAMALLSIPALVVFAWLPLSAAGLVTSRIMAGFSWLLEKTQWILRRRRAPIEDCRILFCDFYIRGGIYVAVSVVVCCIHIPE